MSDGVEAGVEVEARDNNVELSVSNGDLFFFWSASLSVVFLAVVVVVVFGMGKKREREGTDIVKVGTVEEDVLDLLLELHLLSLLEHVSGDIEGQNLLDLTGDVEAVLFCWAISSASSAYNTKTKNNNNVSKKKKTR